MAPDEERRPPKEAPQSEQSGVQADNGNLAQTQPQCQNEHAAQDDLSCFARLLLAEPESVVELRAIGIGGGKARICSGYFDDPGKFAAAARDLDGRAAGIYATLNPVAGGLLARANNRTVLAPPRSTSDDEIARRRLLLVDIDPVRPSGISATEAEKMAAFGVARAVCSYLDALGFPQPIKADSGNGAHIVLAVDLPADDGGLVRRVLEALAFRFDTNAACVDQAVHNPGRLTKVYGTLARKGDSTADRPHRRSRLVSVPASVLRANAHGTAGSGLNAGQYLGRHGLAVHRSSPWQGGGKWVLEVCPFDTTHVDGAAFVVQFGNGAVAAGCHHNGCAGKGWHDLRDAVEPGWRDRAGASGSLGSGSGRGAGESWPEPQPLPTGLPPVLLLDTALLPNRLRPWIEDIAARIRCPVDFPAAAAMVALGSVLGRKLGLRPKQRDDWLVVANLWGGVVGRPGVLKTPGIQETPAPPAWLEKPAKEQ